MATNAEILNRIKANYKQYELAEAASNDAYRKEADWIDKINRDIITLFRGEDFIKLVESYVGKRIMQVDDSGNVIFLHVDGVKFSKWDISFRGNGVRYSGENVAWQENEILIKYSDLDDGALKQINIAEDVDVAEVISRVEEARDARIKKETDYISKRYNGTIEDIKKLTLKPKEVEPMVTIKPDSDVPDLICVTEWKWSELIRRFGSDEEKAALPQDVRATENCENVG
jgi:hypothetical protein